jgi:hypothetical protein
VVSSAIARPFVSGWLLMGGTSIVGTLLGPEGSGGNQVPLTRDTCWGLVVGLVSLVGAALVVYRFISGVSGVGVWCCCCGWWA